MSEKKYVLKRELPKGFLSGSMKGAGVAGVINTAFPSLVPTFTAMITGASKLSIMKKMAIGLGLSSSPALQISNLGILAIGAGIGAIAGTTVSLIRCKHNEHLEKKKVLIKRRDYNEKGF